MNTRAWKYALLGLTAVVVIAPVVYVTVQRTDGGRDGPAPAAVSEDDRRAIEEGEKLRRADRNPPRPESKVQDPFPLAGKGDAGPTTRP